MTFKSRLRAFVLKLVAGALVGEKGNEGSDAIGTLHVSDWVPFENNHLGFFTIYDGDFAKYIQDFADKTSFVFDTVFPHVVGAPPTPVAKNAQAFYQWALEQQLSAHRVLQRLSRPLGSRHSSPAGRSQVTIGHHSIALVSPGHEPDQSGGTRWPRRTQHKQHWRRRGGGFFAERFGRRHENPETNGDSAATEKSALDLADIQGFILRGYRMPMLRHFLLTVGNSGTRAQATWTARQRRRIRRPANHDCRGLARGVRARTGRQSHGGPASQARLLPQHRDHLARTGGAGDTRTRPTAIFQVITKASPVSFRRILHTLTVFSL